MFKRGVGSGLGSKKVSVITPVEARRIAQEKASCHENNATCSTAVKESSFPKTQSNQAQLVVFTYETGKVRPGQQSSSDMFG